MDIVEISYIDTAELEGYIREAMKRWEKSKVNRLGMFYIRTRRVWRDDSYTKAVFYCSFEIAYHYTGPSMMIYIDYDEVEMTGKIEIEYLGTFSNTAKEELVSIINDVIGSFDPSTAPLPFGVKCPHCGAKYVYKTRTGTVNCQNCAKQFDLEYQEDLPLSQEDTAKVRKVKEQTSRYVALDRSKIAHCKWCATVESSSWKHGKYGGIYCSNDCLYADSLEINAFAGCCVLLFPILLFLPFMRYSSTLSGVIPILGIFGIMALVFFYLVFKGNSTRVVRPRNSRRPR